MAGYKQLPFLMPLRTANCCEIAPFHLTAYELAHWSKSGTLYYACLMYF